jgi:hypothetical protein
VHHFAHQAHLFVEWIHQHAVAFSPAADAGTDLENLARRMSSPMIIGIGT